MLAFPAPPIKNRLGVDLRVRNAIGRKDLGGTCHPRQSRARAQSPSPAPASLPFSPARMSLSVNCGSPRDVTSTQTMEWLLISFLMNRPLALSLTHKPNSVDIAGNEAVLYNRTAQPANNH